MESNVKVAISKAIEFMKAHGRSVLLLSLLLLLILLVLLKSLVPLGWLQLHVLLQLPVLLMLVLLSPAACIVLGAFLRLWCCCWLTTLFHGGWPSAATAVALLLPLDLQPEVVLVGVCRGHLPRQIPDLLGTARASMRLASAV